MNDLNFFSILKKQKQKNNTLKIVGAVILVILLIVNGIVGAIMLISTNKVNAAIKQNQDFLASSDTKAKIREAEILTKEVAVANDYLSIMNKVSDSFKGDNLIKVSLVDHIRSLAPGATLFEETRYEGDKVTLNCYTTNTTDPMNYYHALLKDGRFSSVSLPGFSTNFNGIVKYSINMTLKGGGRS